MLEMPLMTAEKEEAPVAVHAPEGQGKVTTPSPRKDTRSGVSPSTLISVLAGLYPGVFVAEQWRPHVPLAVGVGNEPLAAGILTRLELRVALGAYCSRRLYRVALAAGGDRLRLDGTSAGPVSDDHRAHAVEQLAAMDTAAATAAAATLAAFKVARDEREAKRAAEAAAFMANRRARKLQEKRNGATPTDGVTLAATSVAPGQPPRLGLAGLRAAAAARRAANLALAEAKAVAL
jgi:sRNA-binding protein